MSNREVVEELLKAVQTAIKASVKLMDSESEDVQVFAIDAFTKLFEIEAMLLDALSGEARKEQRNPLARRVRIEG
jgi:hypothetical protein